PGARHHLGDALRGDALWLADRRLCHGGGLCGADEAGDAQRRHRPSRASRQFPRMIATPEMMARALDEARAAGAAGEVPVGAVLVDGVGAIIAAGGNRVERDHDPTAHAEMLVLREGAARRGSKRLAGCDLYVT